MQTISRRRSYIGQSVRVELRNGDVMEGTLAAWGPSTIRVRTADGWRETLSTLATVYAK